MTCCVRRVATVLGVIALSTFMGGPASAAAPASPGLPSNMGLCSPYLAGLDPPVFAGEPFGGNARSGVNLLIKAIGPMLPDELDSPGELYRIRAQQHPDSPADQECTPRPAPGGP